MTRGHGRDKSRKGAHRRRSTRFGQVIANEQVIHKGAIVMRVDTSSTQIPE